MEVVQEDDDTVIEVVVSVDGVEHCVAPYDIKLSMRRDRSRSREREWDQRQTYKRGGGNHR